MYEISQLFDIVLENTYLKMFIMRQIHCFFFYRDFFKHQDHNFHYFLALFREAAKKFYLVTRTLRPSPPPRA